MNEKQYSWYSDWNFFWLVLGIFKVLHAKRFDILGDGGATKGSADDAASDSGTAKSAK